MSTLERVTAKDGTEQWWFWCPGCETHHAYTTKAGTTYPNWPTWEFNGDLERPTFTPSLLVNPSYCTCKAQGCTRAHAGRDGLGHRCHLYLTDGVVRYLGDCTHKLAGKSMPFEAARFGPQ